MGPALINHGPYSDRDTHINKGTNYGRCAQKGLAPERQNGTPTISTIAATIVLIVWELSAPALSH